MLKSKIFSLVIIFFILINTDLSEAKGGRGGGGRSRGRSRGGGGFGGWSGGFYDLEIFFYVLAFVVFLVCVFYCVYGCDDDENKNEKDSYQNSNKRSMVQNQQYLRNQDNDTAINLQPVISRPRKQFPVNKNCDAYYGTKVPSYLPYPIAPVTVPAQNSNKRSIAKRSMVQNQQYLRNQDNETAINLQPVISPPRKQFPVNKNCDAYYGTKVPSYLPYPIAPVTVPAPIPGNQNGTLNNGSSIMTNQ